MDGIASFGELGNHESHVSPVRPAPIILGVVFATLGATECATLFATAIYRP
jgi:hypothetical protein